MVFHLSFHLQVFFAVTLPRMRTVLIDVGANCGNSYHLLLETKPLINTTNLEAYLWEANPSFIAWYLEPLAKRDPRVNVVPYAASNRTHHTKFFLTLGQTHLTQEEMNSKFPCDPHSRLNPMGASSLKRVPRAGRTVRVQAVDFAAWMTGLGLHTRDRVIVKIDIEGSEFDVLRHLLRFDVFDVCIVDTWFIEWHVGLVNGSSAASEMELKTQFEARLGQCPKKRTGNHGTGYDTRRWQSWHRY